MQFCPKCGVILQTKNGSFSCVKCGHSTKETKITGVEKMPEKTKAEGVVERDNQHLPIIDGECPKCKNLKVYFWGQQTRAADEGETVFYRCTKCKHTWRSYT